MAVSTVAVGGDGDRKPVWSRGQWQFALVVDEFEDGQWQILRRRWWAEGGRCGSTEEKGEVGLGKARGG